MARIKHRLVEPSDSPSAEIEAISIFIQADWPSEDARWLGPLALSVLRLESKDQTELETLTEHNLRVVAAAWDSSDPRHTRNRALLMAFVRLCGCGGNTGRLGRSVQSSEADALPSRVPLGPANYAKIASTMRSQGANFESALIASGWPGEYQTVVSDFKCFVEGRLTSRDEIPEVIQLMHLLVDHAGVDLASVVDKDSLVALGLRFVEDPSHALRIPKVTDWNFPPTTDPRSLTNWMFGLGPRALKLFLPEYLRSSTVQTVAPMANGIRDSIERWLLMRTNHWTYFHQAGPELGAACEPYLKELEQRCAIVRDKPDLQLRRAWLWFAWCVYESNPSRWDQLAHQDREVVLRAANEDLAGMRALFSSATLKKPQPAVSGEGWGHLAPGDTRQAWEDFAWESSHFDTCVMLLFEFGGVWRGMKPLLLAIRAFGCPTVAKDLRYWPEGTQRSRPSNPNDLVEPPEPWSVVPRSLITLFHAFIGREQAQDPELTNLRGEVAKFCLERLKDRWSDADRKGAARTGRKRTNDDMVERSPEWRLCLIRATASLHINPEGKGHKILKRSSQIDPEEDVREAARTAHEQLRRFKGMPENLSPRRAVISAFWWWRQAHLLGLGIQPDHDGAQRTRTKELTRTREVERAEVSRS